jgi:hypothetical protein
MVMIWLLETNISPRKPTDVWGSDNRASMTITVGTIRPLRQKIVSEIASYQSRSTDLILITMRLNVGWVVYLPTKTRPAFGMAGPMVGEVRQLLHIGRRLVGPSKPDLTKEFTMIVDPKIIQGGQGRPAREMWSNAKSFGIVGLFALILFGLLLVGAFTN